MKRKSLTLIALMSMGCFFGDDNNSEAEAPYQPKPTLLDCKQLDWSCGEQDSKQWERGSELLAQAQTRFEQGESPEQIKAWLLSQEGMKRVDANTEGVIFELTGAMPRMFNLVPDGHDPVWPAQHSFVGAQIGRAQALSTNWVSGNKAPSAVSVRGSREDKRILIHEPLSPVSSRDELEQIAGYLKQQPDYKAAVTRKLPGINPAMPIEVSKLAATYLVPFESWREHEVILFGGIVGGQELSYDIKILEPEGERTFRVRKMPWMVAGVMPKDKCTPELLASINWKGLSCGRIALGNPQGTDKYVDSLIVSGLFLQELGIWPMRHQILHMSSAWSFDLWPNLGTHTSFTAWKGPRDAQSSTKIGQYYKGMLETGLSPEQYAHAYRSQGGNLCLSVQADDQDTCLGGVDYPIFYGMRLSEHAQLFDASGLNRPSELKVEADDQGQLRVIKAQAKIKGVQWSPQGDGSLLYFPLDPKDSPINKNQQGLTVILELEHEGKVLLTEKMVVHADRATSDHYAEWMVPFEAILDKPLTQDKTVKATLHVWVPEIGRHTFETKTITLKTKPLEPRLSGTLSGKVNATLSPANVSFTAKCLLGVNKGNVGYTLESPDGVAGDFVMILDLPAKRGMLGDFPVGPNLPEPAGLTSLFTGAGWDDEGQNWRFASYAQQGTFSLESFPVYPDGGWLAFTYNATHIENLKPEAGTLGIQFEFAHYFEKHPCDQ